MGLAAFCLKPLRLAIARVDQCVASGKRFSRVKVSMRSTSWSLIWRGAPGRGSVRSPSKRRGTKSLPHLPTAVLLSCISALTSVFVLPAAKASNDARPQGRGLGLRSSGAPIVPAFLVRRHRRSTREWGVHDASKSSYLQSRWMRDGIIFIIYAL